MTALEGQLTNDNLTHFQGGLRHFAGAERFQVRDLPHVALQGVDTGVGLQPVDLDVDGAERSLPYVAIGADYVLDS